MILKSDDMFPITLVSSMTFHCKGLVMAILCVIACFTISSSSCDGGDSSPSDKLCLEPMEELSVGITVYSGCQPPYVKDLDDASAVHLFNNPDAVDPSWEELKEFIFQDNTDKNIYSESENACGEFSEAVHNNAEIAGYRAALAVIHIEGETPHALNAFDTTDKGLVYIDCTGAEARSEMTHLQWLYEKDHPSMYDKIAYVVVGKELGFLSVDSNPPFAYELYERQERAKIWVPAGIVTSVEIYW